MQRNSLTHAHTKTIQIKSWSVSDFREYVYYWQAYCPESRSPFQTQIITYITIILRSSPPGIVYPAVKPAYDMLVRRDLKYK